MNALSIDKRLAVVSFRSVTLPPTGRIRGVHRGTDLNLNVYEDKKSGGGPA
jgi:hypothetical protein